MPKIRVWKLGSLEHKVLPTREAISKLKELLEENLGKQEILDIIWDCKLTVEEYEDGPDTSNILLALDSFDGKATLERINELARR